jgi:hypothetical protein
MWGLWREGWMSVREREGEMRCDDWRREGRVRRLVVLGWFGGVESLSGAGPAGWLRKAAAGFRIPRPSAGWFGGGRRWACGERAVWEIGGLVGGGGTMGRLERKDRVGS